jgi:hypothetical protein
VKIFHRYSDLVRVDCGVVAESERDLASRVTWAMESSFGDLNALRDGAIHTIYSGDDVVDVDPGATSRLTRLSARSSMESSLTLRVMEPERVRSDLEPWELFYLG